MIAAIDWNSLLNVTFQVLKVIIGFSLIIFVHELGHFLAARWVGVRVDRFAVGFGTRLFGWRRGEGFTLGNRPNYSAAVLAERGWGETDYCFKALPFGGYVKMLGQDDIVIDEKTDEVKMSDDPRAFINKPVGHRMIVVSAGVIFNVLFAILAFMLVFMTMTQTVPAPVAGQILNDTPAAAVGLQPGDRILTVNGAEIRSYEDIFRNLIISGPSVELEYQRGDEKRRALLQLPDEIRSMPMPHRVGLLPVNTTALESDSMIGTLRAGDRIVAANGQPVSTDVALREAYATTRGAAVELTVERPTEPGGKNYETLTVLDRPMLALGTSRPPPSDPQQAPEMGDLLGLAPLRAVSYVVPGAPAEKAGFRAGDVVLQWGAAPNPRYSELLDIILNSVDQPIHVLVEREGERVPLTVSPRRRFSLWTEGRPEVGLGFTVATWGRPIIADTIPNTPGAALRMPRGAEILSVDDQPVANWAELATALLDRAGRAAVVRYRSGAEEFVGQMEVPGSFVNALDLPVTARLLSIDGESTTTDEAGRRVTLPAPAAARLLLAARVGQRVQLKYLPTATARTPELREFVVKADQLDPWQFRVAFMDPPRAYKLLSEEIPPERNPLIALERGVRYTGSSLVQLYGMLRIMVTRTDTLQNVAGPVGIVNIAVRQAREGYADLLMFLGFLSLNLAVLNFLPLPVVDGGLMVFLILEKIRGRPLHIKTQVAITLIGVAGIVLCFLFVTIQDIVRLFTN